jgi:hypothetical protein
MQQVDLSRGNECYDIPDGKTCSELTFTYNKTTANPGGTKAKLCEWVSDELSAYDTNIEQGAAEASCQCYAAPEDAFTPDDLEYRLNKEVYTACLGMGRRKERAAEKETEEEMCMQNACDQIEGCQWTEVLESDNQRCDISNAFAAYADSLYLDNIGAQNGMSDVDGSEDFFVCMGEETLSGCMSQLNPESGAALCVWDDWGDWDTLFPVPVPGERCHDQTTSDECTAHIAAGGECTWRAKGKVCAYDGPGEEVERVEPTGDCKLFDKCSVDSRYQCEFVGCSWRPYDGLMGDNSAGECARKPTESVMGNAEDTDAWAYNYTCIPFFADDYTTSTTPKTTSVNHNPTSTETTSSTSTTTTGTTTTVYHEDNVDCIETMDDCTVECQLGTERNYKKVR